MTQVFPLKWSDGVEPKLQNRWILEVDGIDAWTLSTAGRPKITQEEIDIKVVNNHAYFKGDSAWETLDITLRDAISPAASKAVYEWLLLCHEQQTGIDGYKAEYSKTIRISLLSPLNTVVEKWKLTKVWPTNIDFGDLDYSATEPVEISMTLRYDNAILEEIATGQ